MYFLSNLKKKMIYARKNEKKCKKVQKNAYFVIFHTHDLVLSTKIYYLCTDLRFLYFHFSRSRFVMNSTAYFLEKRCKITNIMKQCCKNCKFFLPPTGLLRGLCSYYEYLPTVWNKGGNCERFRENY